MNNIDLLEVLKASVNEVRALNGEDPMSDEDWDRQATAQTDWRDIAYAESEPDFESMWEDRYGAPPFWKN